MQKLGTAGGCPELGLPALGSFLVVAIEAMPTLIDCRDRQSPTCSKPSARWPSPTMATCAGRSTTRTSGPEELGSVYESLLELHPEINADAATFELDAAAGNERKTTGSYYTPTSLINCLLDSALDPVLDEAAKKPTRQGGRSRHPRPQGLRPRLRQRPLPHRRRPPHRQAAGRRPHGRRGAGPGSRTARPSAT